MHLQPTVINRFQRAVMLVFDGRGRANRKDYWSFFLGWFVCAAVWMLIAQLTPDVAIIQFIVIGLCIPLMCLAFPMLALVSRRFHDFGWTGWLTPLVLIPFAGYAVLLALGLVPGRADDNRYGPDPSREERDHGLLVPGTTAEP